MGTKTVKLLGVLGVKPNTIRGLGKGWVAYCAKEKEFVTNCYENDPYYEIWDIRMDEAIALVGRKRPKGLAIHGKSIKENLGRNKKRKIARTFHNGSKRGIACD